MISQSTSKGGLHHSDWGGGTLKLSVEEMTFWTPAVFKQSTATRKYLCCPNRNWGGGGSREVKGGDTDSGPLRATPWGFSPSLALMTLSEEDTGASQSPGTKGSDGS